MARTIEFYKGPHGSPASIQTYNEGTSQTFLKGDLVIWDTSDVGVVAVPASSGVPSNQNFLGIALQDATGTDGTPIAVLIPQPGEQFSSSLAESEGSFKAPIGSIDVGEAYGLIKTTSGETVVDQSNGEWVNVISLHPADVQRRDDKETLQVGDRLIFTFQENVLDNTSRKG